MTPAVAVAALCQWYQTEWDAFTFSLGGALFGIGLLLRLREPTQQFHHAVQVTVTRDRVEKRILPADYTVDVEDVLERAVLLHVAPFTRDHVIVLVGMDIIAVGLLAGLSMEYLRTRWSRLKDRSEDAPDRLARARPEQAHPQGGGGGLH